MSKVPYTKPAFTYAQQLQQLKDRGLTIEDDAKALHLLEAISYYRLSGYWYPMLKEPKAKHIFKTGSGFNTAFKLYCFDRELRQLIMGELEKIEVAIRSKMSYVLAHTYGAFWYHNSSLFTDPLAFATTVSKIGNEANRSDEEFAKAFRNKYSDHLPPSWMTLEVTSFGSLSMLYKNLKPGKSKREIAKQFGLDDTTFESWIHSIVYIRNICAHHSRLWNRILRISPKVPASPLKPWISTTTTPHSITGKTVSLHNRTYFLLVMIMYLLNTVNPKHTFKNKLITLFTKFPEADIKSMGFPANWESEPLWK